MCEVYACDRWYVTKLCVKFVCVKFVVVGGGGRTEEEEEEEEARDTESKTRTPHKVVGKNPHTCRNVLVPPHGSMSCCKLSSSVLSWAVLKKRTLSRLQAMQHTVNLKKGDARHSGTWFNPHLTTDRVKPER